MTREMLINMAQAEECRIAIVENKKLEELYIERASTVSHVGNIYTGKIVNVESSIQACFVDFGIGKNGFLHISDVQTTYFKDNKGPKERVGRKRPRRQRPPIQDCFRRGDDVVVQVTKEGIGTKGPTLTTYLSIPGRFLVLMPGMGRLGISRKIEDLDVRSKIRDLLNELDPPKDMGFIVRTAGVGRNKTDLKRDMNYLLRLWKNISKEMKSPGDPTELYRESDLVIRTLRDVFNSDIKKITCDSESALKKVRDFMSIAMPRTSCKASLYDGDITLFDKFGIDEEISRIQSRHLPLDSGGSLVIDSTEALVAIDVNSGKFRVHEDAETTAFKINMEAAPEIARQLRLRDLGGVIIIDFIDMLADKHRRAVEKALRDAVASDRARTKILRISQLGIVEMTRQRMRPSLKHSNYMDCAHCQGSGMIKTPESMAIEVIRRIDSLIDRNNIVDITVSVSHDVAFFLQNQRRAALTELESTNGKTISINADRNFTNDETSYLAHDSRGSAITIES